MNSLIAALAQADPAPFDCILHIGPGPYLQIEDYAPVQARHLILVEADPDASAALTARFSENTDVTVLNTLVQPREGDTLFHCHNLPLLNSPLGLGRIREIYPRVELLESLSMQARTLSAVLEEQTSKVGSRNLLILEIPGQESAILRTLPPHFASRFPSIIISGAGQSWQEGADPIQKSTEVLAGLFFEMQGPAPEDLDWPQLLFRRDPVKASLQLDLDAARKDMELARSQAVGLETQLAELLAERDQQARLAAERQAELDATRQELERARSHAAGLETQRVGLLAERDTYATERDDQAKLAADRLAELEALHKRLELANVQVAELEKKRTILFSELNEKKQFIESSYKQRRTIDDLRHAEFMGAFSKLTQERDALAEKVSTLESELAQAHMKNAMLDDSMLKAEAQLQFIKEVFLHG